MERKLVIVKVGTTLPSIAARRGDFEDWVLAGMGLTPADVRIARPRRGEPWPQLQTIAGGVVPGSHAMVTDHEAWSERTADWLRAVLAARIPVLGICYGHQLLAYACGGEVADNSNGREFGTVAAYLTPEGQADALLGNMENVLQVHASHKQSVVRLSTGARVLASSAMDPHLAFAVGDRAWGVQFHPEFDADVVSAYIRKEAVVLTAEEQQPTHLVTTVRETPYGRTILRRFAQLAMTFTTRVREEAPSTL
ncbi:MAG: glutamine amidotransferase [Anaerolineae bacterium]